MKTSLACALALGVLSSDLGLGPVGSFGSSMLVNAEEAGSVDASPLVSNAINSWYLRCVLFLLAPVLPCFDGFTVTVVFLEEK